MKNPKTLAAFTLLGILLIASFLYVTGPGRTSTQKTEVEAPPSSPNLGVDPTVRLPDDKRTRPQPNPTAARDTKVRIRSGINLLADASPNLINRLQLTLFDDGFTPVTEDWDLLGIEKAEADALGETLKNIFSEIKEQEFNQFDLYDRSDNQVRIALPRMTPEDAARRNAQIENAFGAVFDGSSAKAMAGVFLKNHPAISAGIIGSDRIITITALSPQVTADTKDRYEIKTNVLFGNNRISDITGSIDSFSSIASYERSSEIPKSWQHLIEK